MMDILATWLVAAIIGFVCGLIIAAILIMLEDG